MKFPDEYRSLDEPPPYNSKHGERYGMFYIHERPRINTRDLKVMASDGDVVGWEHVSVTLRFAKKRSIEPPTWAEMCLVKSIFWDPEEWVVQYHPAQEHYISIHDGCLHLWRPTKAIMPTPPMILV